MCIALLLIYLPLPICALPLSVPPMISESVKQEEEPKATSARLELAKPKRALPQDEADVLVIEIEEMMRLDQLYRTPVSWGTTDPAELERLEALDDDASLAEWARRNREGVNLPKALQDELMTKQGKLDASNLLQLAEIIESIGYPGPELLGVNAPDPLPVLIHATLEGYDSVAPMLLEEALAGRMRARSFAALTDRKRQHRGLIQIYGMCHAMDRETGRPLPPEVESIDATNKARKELGMPPLEEYRIAEAKEPVDPQQPVD